MSMNGDDKISKAAGKSMERRPIEVLTIIMLPDGNIHVTAPLDNLPLCANMLKGAMSLIGKIAQERSKIVVPKIIMPN